MHKRTVELSVGAFMILGFLAMVFMALQVSGLTTAESDKTYELVAYFDNAGSLKARSKVSMAGVTIGRVTSVSLDKERYMAKVTMAIDSNINNIPLDSTAAIMTAGLLGEQFINVSIGGEMDYLLPGNQFEDTQSALILEELIGKFMMNTANN